MDKWLDYLFCQAMVPVNRHKTCIKAVERLTVTVTLNYVQYEMMMNNNLASVDVFLHTHENRRFKNSACSKWS